MIKDNLENRLLDNCTEDNITGCWNWNLKCDNGYGRIKIEGKQYKVSRISAMLWLDFDINSELEVLHSCDNKKCLNPNHLFIGTQKDNIQDCIKKGRYVSYFRNNRGSKHINSKLVEKEVIEILDLYKNKIFTQQELGDMYGVSQSSICDIVSKGAWKHVLNEVY